MAAMLGDRVGRMAISAQTMRGLLDSIATRLDEARDISRYLTGLLVFLGLLGTFWGLIETVGSVGSVINGLKVGGDAGAVFDSLKEGLAAPLGGMGISFSSSLFGLAGSLVLGFLDLQTEPGAEPLLHRSRGLARRPRCSDLGVGIAMAAAPGRRRRRACERASSGCASAVERRRVEPGDDHRHGQSRRSDPGAGAAHAHRAADDPRLGEAQAEQQREIRRCWRSWSREQRAQVESRDAAHGACPQPPRQRHELLAGLRRRPVDADARHHLPAHRVRGRAVLLCRRKSPARTPRSPASTRRSRS